MTSVTTVVVNDILIAENRDISQSDNRLRIRAAKYQTSVSRCRLSAWEDEAPHTAQLRLEQQLKR